MASRDNFKKTVVDTLVKRSAFICSNPDCRKLTIAPSQEDPDKFIYIAEAAHIKAAASGGPRYDPTMTSEERSSIGNALFLCSNCADMIDKNHGIDFSVEDLHSWKTEHESWIRNNLNKKIDTEITSSITQQTTYNISSNNQSGGITAGVVNVNKSRTIENTSVILNKLLGALVQYKNNIIKVTATMGDGESVQYAKQIQGLFRKNGFEVEDFISQVVWEGAMPAISYNDVNNQISVNVGSNI